MVFLGWLQQGGDTHAFLRRLSWTRKQRDIQPHDPEEATEVDRFPAEWLTGRTLIRRSVAEMLCWYLVWICAVRWRDLGKGECLSLGNIQTKLCWPGVLRCRQGFIKIWKWTLQVLLVCYRVRDTWKHLWGAWGKQGGLPRVRIDWRARILRLQEPTAQLRTLTHCLRDSGLKNVCDFCVPINCVIDGLKTPFRKYWL